MVELDKDHLPDIAYEKKQGMIPNSMLLQICLIEVIVLKGGHLG